MKFKKVLTSFMATLFLITTLDGTSVFAMETSTNLPPAVTISASQNIAITPYAEETDWFFRTVDGKLQMRLWSLTYGKWRTDWIWC